MASHPSEKGCICEWDGDDHYFHMIAFTKDCPIHRCGTLIYEDENIRCCLQIDHTGDHKSLRSPYKLDIKPYMRIVEKYEEDENYKSVSRRDGIYYAVPNWIAELLERHADEIA